MSMKLRSRAVTFVNSGDPPGSLRVVGARIADVGCRPVAGDRVVDLRGDRLLPGLINAHDHLQLNTLPPLQSGGHYTHVRDWIWDVDHRRRTDPLFEALVREPLDDRLLIGGVKNLLSGVTTVAHHDPLYPFLLDAGFPTRLLTRCGWSHSLYIDGEQQVRDSCMGTPLEEPWIIHAAEGTSEEAAREFDRLEGLGCVRSNTLLVHGVALDAERMRRLDQASAGLIWCPSSNLRLFGTTANVYELAARGRVALGTDSRLSGGRDLLEELRVANESTGICETMLESMVTGAGAALLRLSDRGSLAPGSLADLVVLPAGMPVTRATRADIGLVVIGGSARYADQAYANAIVPRGPWSTVRVDGRPKLLERNLVAAVLAAKSREPGLEIPGLSWRAA